MGIRQDTMHIILVLSLLSPLPAQMMRRHMHLISNSGASSPRLTILGLAHVMVVGCALGPSFAYADDACESDVVARTWCCPHVTRSHHKSRRFGPTSSCVGAQSLRHA